MARTKTKRNRPPASSYKRQMTLSNQHRGRQPYNVAVRALLHGLMPVPWFQGLCCQTFLLAAHRIQTKTNYRASKHAATRMVSRSRRRGNTQTGFQVQLQKRFAAKRSSSPRTEYKRKLIIKQANTQQTRMVPRHRRRGNTQTGFQVQLQER